jgi:sugar lactone lactonase YvrE
MILIWFLSLATLPALAQVSRESPAKKTAIDGPGSLALDKDGHLFVAEIYGNVVRRVDLRTKMMSTVAGTGKPCCYREGAKAIEVSLEFPRALAVDSSGNLFIAEGEFIRKVDVQTGLISTFAGREKSGDTKEGLSIKSASFQRITSLAISSAGEMYIADDIQGKIFKINSQNRKVSRVAGSGLKGFSGDGGPALNATFRFIESIALDPAGNLFIADSENCRIRGVDHQTGVINTVAITGDSKQKCPPQPGTNPLLPAPDDLAVGPDGNLYFVEPAINVVVLSDKANNLSIVAGTGSIGFSGDGALATGAELSGPSGLAIDSNGNFFVSDCRNNRIRQVDARTKVIITIAGNGFPHTIHSEE